METQPQFKEGDRVFSHYTKHVAAGVSGWGTIAKIGDTRRGAKHGVTGDPLPDTTWYTVRTDEGGRELLDDAHGNWEMARIVPPHIAERYGYGADPNPREQLHHVCKTAGIQIMSDVFDIIIDRDEATLEQILAFLDDGDHDPVALYETFIVKGINRLSDSIQEVTP